MLSTEIEKRLATIISWGALAVTLLVTDRISTDPANVGKMIALTFVAGSALAILFNARKSLFGVFKSAMLLNLGFILISFISILMSKNPWEKGFYGTFGRNTGFLTYISLTILFLACTQFSKTESYLRIIRVLFLTGIFNIVYCFLVLSGTDIFAWENPYGKVLGTFGNPNFISSFMGIFFIASAALFFSHSINSYQRLFILSVGMCSLFIIKQSASQQGGVVAAGGLSLVLYFFLRSKYKNKLINLTYVFTLISLGVFSILGMLQKGPLAELLYKQSVSLRGEYWQAGINMGLSNPAFGVGLDSYGTFYRAYRNESSLLNPGVNTITDSAHNVFIDVFASTGFIGILFYAGIIVLILIESLKFINKNLRFDPIFVILFSSWLGYQAQSVISINQIGLAVWGWLLGGLLLGYTRKDNLQLAVFSEVKFRKFLKIEKEKSKKEVSAAVVLGTFVGALSLFFLAVPSFYADAHLRQSMASGEVEKLYLSAQKFPLDPNRINFVASKISQGEINEQTVTLIRLGLAKYPYDFGLLYSQFQLSPDDSLEKIEIGKRLYAADPFNPSFRIYR